MGTTFGMVTVMLDKCVLILTLSLGYFTLTAVLDCHPTEWTREYAGYLMTEYRGYITATFECVDKNAEEVMQMLTAHFSTTLKPPAMDSHVLPMIQRMSSPV